MIAVRVQLSRKYFLAAFQVGPAYSFLISLYMSWPEPNRTAGCLQWFVRFAVPAVPGRIFVRSRTNAEQVCPAALMMATNSARNSLTACPASSMHIVTGSCFRRLLAMALLVHRHFQAPVRFRHARWKGVRKLYSAPRSLAPCSRRYGAAGQRLRQASPEADCL